jgi:hypothetical protein
VKVPGLDRLEPFLGRWKGSYANQFGEEGVLESSSECTKELDGRFIQWKGETKKDGVPINSSIEFIAFDARLHKYIMKRLWSYGFIENGVGDWTDDTTLTFDIKNFDNPPPGFEGKGWRSFIRVYGKDEIGHGLLVSEHGGEYRPYGESRVFRATARHR